MNKIKVKKYDRISAFNPSARHLTHDKDYIVESVLSDGCIVVKNDHGALKRYAPSNFLI